MAVTRPTGACPLVLVSGKDPVGPVGGRIGGHAIYVRAHARAARRTGFEPHLVALADRAGVVTGGLGTIHRVRAGTWPGRPWVVPLHGPMLAAAVERLVRGWGSGRVLLHGFGVWGDAAVVAAERLRRRGVSAHAIVSAYGTYLHEAEAMVTGLDRAASLVDRARFRALRAWVRLAVDRHERRAARRASMVLLNYASVERLLRRAYGDALRLRRIPYTSESAFLDGPPETLPGAGGGDLPAALARLVPDGAPLVMTVARHDPRKGLALLLRALARLQALGVGFRAVLVGGGDLLSAHRRLAAGLGLGPRVAIEGFVPDPRPYLRAADLFVLPSLRESSGSLAVIEALQHGLPVVASTCDGLPEDVEDGESGILVPPGDLGALTGALGRLLADARLRARLSLGAREAFREHFSPERFQDALRAVYGELGCHPTAARGPDAAGVLSSDAPEGRDA